MDNKKFIILGKPEKKRKAKKIIELSDDAKSYESQLSLLQILREEKKDTTKEEYTLAKREINKKIASYKKQDIDKNRYVESNFITFDETVDLLCKSQLLCYYCRKQMCIFYDNVREKSQWTLDRVDNDICHSKDNLVVSCLSCNLQKRRRESEAFKFMKQMKIEKQK
jgi:hypothetical protein